MKNIIQKIYSIVLEELITEGVKDDLITYFGGSDEVKELVTKYWSDFRNRLRGRPEADANFWKKNSKSFDDFKEVMKPFLEKIEKKTDYKNMSLYDYWEVIPDSQLYRYDNIPSEIQSKMKYDKVFEDSDWLIVVPNDQDTSIIFSKLKKGALGSGDEDVGHCTWCTGTHYLPNNLFHRYAENGAQFIIIDKKNEKKYNIQLSFSKSDNKQTEMNDSIYDYNIFPANVIQSILDFQKNKTEDIVKFINTCLRYPVYYKNLKNLYIKQLNNVNAEEYSRHLTNLNNANNLKLVKDAIEYGIDPKIDNSVALLNAVYNKNIEVVKFLIPFSDCKANNSDALDAAINHSRNIEIIKLLIPYSDNELISNRFIYSAISAQDIEIIKLLLPYINMDNNFNDIFEHVLKFSSDDDQYLNIIKIFLPLIKPGYTLPQNIVKYIFSREKLHVLKIVKQYIDFEHIIINSSFFNDIVSNENRLFMDYIIDDLSAESVGNFILKTLYYNSFEMFKYSMKGIDRIKDNEPILEKIIDVIMEGLFINNADIREMNINELKKHVPGDIINKLTNKFRKIS